MDTTFGGTEVPKYMDQENQQCSKCWTSHCKEVTEQWSFVYHKKLDVYMKEKKLNHKEQLE